MKVDSPEYKALMKKWSNDAWHEELERDRDSYYENHQNEAIKQNCENCPFSNKATFTCQLNHHISVYGQKSCVIGYTVSEIQAKTHE